MDHWAARDVRRSAALNAVGVAFLWLGDFRKAIEYHGQYLAICCETGDRAGEGGAYGNLGISYRNLGDFSRAIEHHDQDLAIEREEGDRAGEGRNIGNAYHRIGDVRKAIECHKQCVAIAREVGDRTGEGRAYGSLGNACCSLGDFGKAIAYHEHHLGDCVPRASPGDLL